MFWCFNKASNIDRKETLIYKEKADTRCLVFSTTFNKKLSNIRQCFDVLIRPRTLTVRKPIYTRRKLIEDVFSFPQLSIKSWTKCLAIKKLSNIRQCFDVLIRPRTLTVKKPIYTRRKLIQDVLSFPQLSIKSYQILGNVLMF